MSFAPSKTRVLFVDDEPLVLQGLQRTLRRLSNEWEMAFVSSGQAALQAMAAGAYSVVVTDMRMPGMNGVELLSEIARAYPKTVRLILSGHADKNLIVQCVGTAHQFLAKPCEPGDLKLAVQSAQKFESSIKCEMLRDLIGRMETLPSAPTLFHKIVKELRDENTSLDDVGEIISSDIGMTAKLLKLVNSAFFGLKRQINNPAEAVTYLGLETIKALVLAVHAFDCFDGKDTGPLSLDKLWGHSLAVANWSRTIAREENSSASEIEETFTCGVLHDVGKLALSSNLPDLYRETLQLIAQQKFPLLEAEEKIFGANHADVGGYLLSLWGLPPRVVDPISFHHNPRQSAVGEMGPLAFVHAADAFVNEVDETADSGASIDEAYFAQYNFRENLSIWKGLQP